MHLRVISWNIHKGIGGADRKYRLDRTIELIQAVQPDVALLQEVAEGWPQARFEVQVDELREALDLPYVVFGPEHRFKQGGYGNAILCRWPLHDTHHVDLTVGWRKKRGALQARTIVRRGGHQRTVVINNLHLGLAGSERAEQLRRFLACEPFAGIDPQTPLVVGGDLNDLWGSLGPKFLAPAGFQRAGLLQNTFPAYMPIRPLDGIFVRGAVQVHEAGAWTGPLARSASDHLPLVANIELMSRGDRQSRPSWTGEIEIDPSELPVSASDSSTSAPSTSR
ncbi:MAG: endonuclease [Myxococcales bacterium]|nr:endonuclease [Myxococcales bacterium]